MEATLTSGAEFLAKHFFEIVSVLIATIALVYAGLAYRVAKQSLKATEDADLARLKLTAIDRVQEAEKVYLSLQSQCRKTREAWAEHHGRSFPALSPTCPLKQDTVHVAQIEKEGRQRIEDLRSRSKKIREMPKDDTEGFIAHTDAVVLEIERLSFHLSLPKAFSRYGV